MSKWQIHVEGVGLYGPGMSGWDQAREVLAGRAAIESDELRLPVPQALPPAERRRVGLTLKLALACGMEALAQAEADPAQVASVFTSSAGDCDNCHQILCALAESDRAVSPTRFHNSVHNMPAGYWSIATGCMAPSTSLCAYDASFVAGLLEAATQVSCTGRPCLLVAFDTSYPEPLRTLRPIPHPFGAALLLSPQRTPRTLATLELAQAQAPVTPMRDAALEAVRAQVPSARGLPLLQALAEGAETEVVLDYLGHKALQVGVRP